MRTFVVNYLRLGISAEVIMKWTGHSDFTAMRPYVAIVDELKKESMAKYNVLYENEKKVVILQLIIVRLLPNTVYPICTHNIHIEVEPRGT